MQTVSGPGIPYGTGLAPKAAQTMPLQNRVDPFGDIFATPHKGGFMGNRGGRLHDAHKHIVKRWTNRTWIICVLAFKGRRRTIMGPNTYTELFFVDEATALAAGHRPCAECRRADYNAFKAAFIESQARQGVTITTATDMDRVLHQQRIERPRPRSGTRDLPDGAMAAFDGKPWLKLGDHLHLWTPGGYADRMALPAQDIEILIPASTLAVLRAGYRPQVDASQSAVSHGD